MSTHPCDLYAQKTHPHAEFNVLKCTEKYSIEFLQDSHPAKQLFPYRKIKFDKLRTYLSEKEEIKQKPCLHVIRQMPLRDFV